MAEGIACAGHLIVDNVKLIDSYPEEGMLVSIASEQQHGGGLVFNCLSNLATLSPALPLFALGITGDDDRGHYITDKLASQGIDCSHVQTTCSAPTSYTDVMTVKNGQRTFFHMEGANALLDVPHLLNNSLQPKIFHLGYLTLLKQLDHKDSERGYKGAFVLKKMKERGCITSVDLVSVAHKDYVDIVTAVLPYTDYLIINEIEAGMATGLLLRDNNAILSRQVEKAAKHLLEKGNSRLVVIHYPEGASCFTRQGEIFQVSAFSCPQEQIRGTVGAGDAFCSGMLYALYFDLPIELGLKFACACARFSLLHENSTDGMVSAEMINHFLDSAAR